MVLLEFFKKQKNYSEKEMKKLLSLLTNKKKKLTKKLKKNLKRKRLIKNSEKCKKMLKPVDYINLIFEFQIKLLLLKKNFKSNNFF